MNRKSIGLWIALLAVGTSGCGVELVGGAETGEAETVMTDDAAAEQEGAERTAGMSMSRSMDGSEQIIDVDGAVTADVSVSLLTAAGGAVPITSEGVTGVVRIGSTGRAVLDRRDVLATAYPSVRVTFTRVEAQLETSIQGPGGLVLPLAIEVDLSGEPLVIEVPLEVLVRENERTTIEIDLNAGLWLVLADPVTGLVPRAAFANAVKLRVEG